MDNTIGKEAIKSLFLEKLIPSILGLWIVGFGFGFSLASIAYEMQDTGIYISFAYAYTYGFIKQHDIR